MALRHRFAVAGAAPGAEGAFAAIGRERWRLAVRQIRGQLAQGITKLAPQTMGEPDPIALQAPAASSHNKHLRDRCLLLLLQQVSHQSQRQLMFAGQPPPLTGQNRLIGVRPPATVSFHFEQKRRMGLHRFPGRPGTLQPQTHHPCSTLPTGGLTP